MNGCSIAECTKTTRLKRGLCSMHYQRWLEYGDPFHITRAAKGTGSISRDGYRRRRVADKKVMEHRFVWEQAYGPIPDGFLIHHKNGNKLDNRIDNLELYHRGEHTQYHKPQRFADCHPDKPRKGNGLCARCYERRRNELRVLSGYYRRPDVKARTAETTRRYRERKRLGGGS